MQFNIRCHDYRGITDSWKLEGGWRPGSPKGHPNTHTLLSHLDKEDSLLYQLSLMARSSLPAPLASSASTVCSSLSGSSERAWSQDSRAVVRTEAGPDEECGQCGVRDHTLMTLSSKPHASMSTLAEMAALHTPLYELMTLYRASDRPGWGRPRTLLMTELRAASSSRVQSGGGEQSPCGEHGKRVSKSENTQDGTRPSSSSISMYRFRIWRK